MQKINWRHYILKLVIKLCTGCIEMCRNTPLITYKEFMTFYLRKIVVYNICKYSLIEMKAT